MSGSKTAIGVFVGALLIAGIGGAAWLYAGAGAVSKGSEPADAPKSNLARFAVGPLAALETPQAVPVAPDHVFKTREGADARFSDFRGKVVVVNLWAMWCVPCRTEMPTLARLAQAYPAQAYPGGDLVVLPINVDIEADKIADAKSFIDVHEPLPLYSDPKFELPFKFPGKGKMPQTILLDRQGRIRATFAGEADWSSPEARALVEALLQEGR